MCLMQINRFTKCKERIIYFIKDGGDMLKSRKVRKGMALILGHAVLFAMAGKAKAANKVVREGISVSGYTNKMADGTWRDINWKK